MKKAYRDNIEILYDVAKICDGSDSKNPAIVSVISAKGDMSNSASKDKIMILGKAGIIDSYKYIATTPGNNQIMAHRPEYKTTQKGKDFIYSFEAMRKLLEPVRNFDYKKITELGL